MPPVRVFVTAVGDNHNFNTGLGIFKISNNFQKLMCVDGVAIIAAECKFLYMLMYERLGEVLPEEF
jgi:hypothetical protein